MRFIGVNSLKLLVKMRTQLMDATDDVHRQIMQVGLIHSSIYRIVRLVQWSATSSNISKRWDRTSSAVKHEALLSLMLIKALLEIFLECSALYFRKQIPVTIPPWPPELARPLDRLDHEIEIHRNSRINSYFLWRFLRISGEFMRVLLREVLHMHLATLSIFAEEVNHGVLRDCFTREVQMRVHR